MTAERWEQIKGVLHQAMQLPPEQRAVFLDQACAGDSSLRREVESLLAADDQARSSFLQAPPLLHLEKGVRLGDYEIQNLLGAGGMGEVYRARDVRLHREVAIKVLPAAFASDADRLRRFEQEATAAAALNHPNILAVHQMGTYQGAPYLVSELLEGETLREPIRRGRLAVRKAMDYGIQITRGLAAAHEKGIVHRDLKPENLFVTKDGRVKILDFGLAKLTQRAAELTRTATALDPGTEPGMVMGTAGYMSPEQVRGQPADHRTDIFSFGAILYEMLTGKRAFQKITSAETMSAILNEDPPSISQLAPTIPPALQRVVHRCLEKSPEQRFQSASDLAFALDGLSDSGTSSASAIAQERSRHIQPWTAASVLIIGALAGILWWVTRSPKAMPTPSLTRLTWDSALTTDPALSPDGKLLAYASDRSGEGHLDIYVQQVGGGEPLRLTRGPGDNRAPTFSPDGTTVAFDSEQDEGGIYVVSALGGPARKLVGEGYGPQFSPDGKWIAYSIGGVGAAGLNIPGHARMYVIASAGGVPRQVRPDFAAALYPIWSPDSQHLLFLGNPDASKPPETVDWWVTPLSEGPAVKTGTLETTRQAKLGGDFQGYPSALARPNWEPDGSGLIFSARSGDSTNLWRIAISPTTFKVAGLPQRLTFGLAREESPSVVSGANGTIRIAFASISENVAVWSLPLKPNEGKVAGELQQLTHDAGGDFMPSIARDGGRVVFISTRPGNQEIWTKDLRTGQASALTATRMNKYYPTFSPDGSMVSFSISPSWDVYVMPSTGGVADMVCEGCGEATDWSSDGKRIIGNTVDGRAWVLDLASRRRSDLLATRHWIATDSFSPDNLWFSFLGVDNAFHAYIARVSEIPVPESEWIEVIDGEAQTWSPDGNLLYATSYRDGHYCIWARRLHPATRQPVGAPFAVFHFHNARLSLASEQELSIAGNKMVFSMGERTANIWMAEWKER